MYEYTKEWRDDSNRGIADGGWAIMSPDDVEICIVTSEEGANGLLTHLNRG